jgi:hypothetical protein
MKTKTNVRAGGLLNHNQTGIVVRSKVKAGGISMQHNQTGLRVRSKVKAGLNYTKITY